MRWVRVEGRQPKFYHSTDACFAQLDEYDEDNEGAARSVGMTLCPDCEREERRNAIAQLGEPSFRTGG